VDEIVAQLLFEAQAQGVWLLKGEHVFAAATADASVTPPRVWVDGEAFIELNGVQLFASPIRGATLVVVFDKRSTLGLVRLRVKQAHKALENALWAS
jgi:hypothetical protein